ncbi:DNA adenine methylase [Spirulina sp. 06S082]|uniref:DNA adenine methylase n=1 Tax=Spirulina sp. 06S082 TaxID=3110248 RepID=UPI002B1FBC9D|nr:DNA adenine methylase [Spirulina sp. 06S082]MEA5469282.1 DNA adenine methylase [Spirulina sp. 06S082]
MSKFIKSPLRYPGGKSRAIQKIIRYMPHSFSEYREPFIGGGSIFIYLKQKFPNLKFWINDLNTELYYFWKTLKLDPENLIEESEFMKDIYIDGKSLFKELANINTEDLTGDERAIRFFVLNRISFSGTIESGGFSKESFLDRFTYSSIERLKPLQEILENTKITNLDYSEVLQQPGDNVFIFLDPPYLAATSSRLYGKRGNLHTSFDHHRFANLLKDCPHQWLITYDDSPEIRENFKFAYIHEWELQYGMNNYKQKTAGKGRELMITNYPVKEGNNKPVQLSLNLEV